MSRDEDCGSSLRLMTTASTPATPGPSTPTGTRIIPLDQLNRMEGLEGCAEEDLVPPERPSSTPFPQQELPESRVQFPRLTLVETANPLSSSLDTNMQRLVDLSVLDGESAWPEPNKLSLLCSLPTEIHEKILDHLFGERLSATSRGASTDALRNWNTKLRHCRRREVSDLAFVSMKWKGLIQDRLYRHIKVKGTRESIDAAQLYFLSKRHLTTYVKHIEIWFPVFQRKSVSDRNIRVPAIGPSRPVVPLFLTQDQSTQLQIYSSPHNNCTLEEVFRFCQFTFGKACVLTLEGGERKKPPMIQQFSSQAADDLPRLPNITTLVSKGQWNLMRSNDDFQTIAKALPNLIEWHSSYSKPKSKSYLFMATILPQLPTNLTHLNLVLESDYRRESVSPAFYRKVTAKVHFCREMAKAMPALEHFSYTGRVCGSFFDVAAAKSDKRSSRLRTVELSVKNVCRPKHQWNDGSGMYDANFITTFEDLTVSACRSLNTLTALELVRIKFIDLGRSEKSGRVLSSANNPDSQMPSYNPWFELKDNTCTGIWSERIVQELSLSRPHASYPASETPVDVPITKDGSLLPSPTTGKTARPRCIKVSSYLALSAGFTIT